jgi:hypothetical protein
MPMKFGKHSVMAAFPSVVFGSRPFGNGLFHQIGRPRIPDFRPGFDVGVVPGSEVPTGVVFTMKDGVP